MSLPAERHPAWHAPEGSDSAGRAWLLRRPSGAPETPLRPNPGDARRVAAPAVRSRPRRKHHVGFAIAAAVLLGPMVFGIAGLNALLAQQSFRLDEVEQRIASLTTEQQELVQEQARLSAPGRIAAWARRMGMRLPDDIRPLHAPGEDQAAPAGAAGAAGGGP